MDAATAPPATGRVPSSTGPSLRDWFADTLIAVALGVLVVTSVLSGDASSGYDFREPNALLVVLALTASLPLSARRRWPLAVLAVVAAATFAISAADWPARDAPFCLMFALYTTGAWPDRGRALAGLAVGLLPLAVLTLLRAPYFDGPGALVIVAFMVGAWGLGVVMAMQRRSRELAIADALDQERARAVAAERAVFGERLRAAREMHDIVSHTLSLIAVQAGVARYQLDGEPTPARDALVAVEEASRSGLDDLRRMLTVLRSDRGADRDDVRTPGLPSTPAADPISGMWARWANPALATALATFGLVKVSQEETSAGFGLPGPDVWLLVALTLVATLPLAVRRRFPLIVLAFAAGAMLFVSLSGANSDIAGLSASVALYSVAVWRHFAASLLALALMSAAEAIPVLLGTPDLAYTQDLAGLGLLVPWALGLVVRRWHQDRDAANQRALEAARTRAERAERAVLSERVRIASEMHDVIAHTLSVVAVQSAVARHALGDQPAGGTAETLRTVEDASRQALGDLRDMVGVLQRTDGGNVAPAALVPSPGIEDVRLLVAAHRPHCGAVDLTIEPEALNVPGTMQLAAYRIVQEALTNVQKHAPGARTWVSVSRHEGDLVVEVDDDGPSRSGPDDRRPVSAVRGLGGGYGLVGMRERVGLFGGLLEAGPCDNGGYRITAVLSDVRREVTA